MSKFPLSHLLFILVGGALPSCGDSNHKTIQPYVTQRQTKNIQTLIDRCVAETGTTACDSLCQEVFQLAGDPGTCKVETVGEQSTVRVEATYGPQEPPSGCGAPGRRPTGLQCAPVPAPSPVAAYLAWAAQMEAASVTAFARIYRHLAADGAPAELLSDVRAAIEDEIFHTHLMFGLACRAGARPSPPSVVADPGMSLFERAVDNAVEGCVGETVAALHAAYIATRAEDAVIRAVFARIAVDESRHAVLAHDLAAYYARHLSDAENTRVTAARDAAARLAIATPASPAMSALGIPADGELAASTAKLLLHLPA